MSRKYHSTSVQEYGFLKTKVLKILGKQRIETPVKTARAKKQVRKFVKRLKEIESYHEKMGWPHPEAEFKPREGLKRELESTRINLGKQALTNPDGSLYQKSLGADSNAGVIIPARGASKPDGTPFETPILPGAILSPQYHSEDKINEFMIKFDSNEE